MFRQVVKKLASNAKVYESEERGRERESGRGREKAIFKEDFRKLVSAISQS